MINNVLVLQHIECEPLGVFEKVLETEGILFRYVKLYKDDYPSIDIDKHTGLIILGGPMSVDQIDKYSYLGWEMDLIKKAQNRNLPILGICLGAQLIAKANGATVKKGVAREVGWHKVKLTEEGAMNRLFSGLDKEFCVFQLHSDMFEIPHQAKRLAYSQKCKNQAFSIGDNVYGLQFHLEVNKKMIQEWFKVYKDDLTDQDRVNIMDSLDNNLEELNKKGRSFFGNFLRL